MNRFRSSSRALGRSHCKHLQERREGGKVMAVLLRGEEGAQKGDPPLSSKTRIHALFIKKVG